MVRVEKVFYNIWERNDLSVEVKDKIRIFFKIMFG